MLSRLAPAALVVALVAGLATGCFARPDSEPTPVFETEEEAFAAAEETYRAYVDALNQVDLSDPETFEDVYAWTTGEANAGARESFTQMHADGWIVSGSSTVTRMEPLEASIAPPSTVSLFACLDVSGIELTDSSGQSMVDADRPDVQEVRIDSVESRESPTGLLIERLDGYDGKPCI